MLDILRSREFKRSVRRALVLALLFMLGACAYWTTYPLHAQSTDSAVYVTTVHVDSAAEEWLTQYRSMLTAETVMCLYGVVKGDTAFVAFFKPTRTYKSSAAYVYYAECPEPRPEVFGPVIWLGTWHNHVSMPEINDGCYFSATDDKSFYGNPRSVLELVGCDKGLIARGRKK
jgi:hypothetical protein